MKVRLTCVFHARHSQYCVTTKRIYKFGTPTFGVQHGYVLIKQEYNPPSLRKIRRFRIYDGWERWHNSVMPPNVLVCLIMGQMCNVPPNRRDDLMYRPLPLLVLYLYVRLFFLYTSYTRIIPICLNFRGQGLSLPILEHLVMWYHSVFKCGPGALRLRVTYNQCFSSSSWNSRIWLVTWVTSDPS